MGSSYPSSLDSFPTNRSNTTQQSNTHPGDHNNFADAINKIEAELGTVPKGSYSSVKSRLAALEASLQVVPRKLITAGYTLAAADIATCLEFTGGSAAQITIPSESSLQFAEGAWVEVLQRSNAVLTIAGEVAGMILTPLSPQVAVDSIVVTPRNGVVTLRKRQTGFDHWHVMGSHALS